MLTNDNGEDTTGGIWGDDQLERKELAEYLATFLRNRSEEFVQRDEQRSFVLNIDARWGDGKTFL